MENKVVLNLVDQKLVPEMEMGKQKHKCKIVAFVFLIFLRNYAHLKTANIINILLFKQLE